MNEAYIRQTINRDLREYGYWPITNTDASRCSRCGGLVKPEIGRPDTLVLHPTDSCFVVEYKILKTRALPFSEIRDDQRKWLNRWLDDGGTGYIGIAVVGKPKKYHRWLDMFLVDWEYWLEVEEECILAGSKSIPYTWHNRARVPEQLDMAHKFKAFRMHKADGKWRLPLNHTAIP